MPPVRRTRHTQSRPASEARPSARCTAPPSRTAPQTPEARPSDPSRPIGHATVGRDDEQEHSENLCYLDRDTNWTSASVRLSPSFVIDQTPRLLLSIAPTFFK